MRTLHLHFLDGHEIAINLDNIAWYSSADPNRPLAESTIVMLMGASVVVREGYEEIEALIESGDRVRGAQEEGGKGKSAKPLSA